MNTRGGASSERSALERHAAARRLALQRPAQTITVWFSDPQRRFKVNLCGVFDTARSLMLSAPAGADGQLVAVMRDQPINCLWTTPLAIYEFKGVVTELGFKPQPLLHVGQLHAVRRSSQRRLPRVPVALPAALTAGQTIAALVTDLSTAGAQVAVAAETTLAAGQSLELAIRLRLQGNERNLKLGSQVVASRNEASTDDSGVRHYGLSFVAPDEISALVLHGFVQQMMLEQADRIGSMLHQEAEETGATTVATTLPGASSRMR